MDREKAMSDMIRKMNGYDEVCIGNSECDELKVLKSKVNALEVTVLVLLNEMKVLEGKLN